MRILYIYRSKDSGPSIRRVFEPIEDELRTYYSIDSVYLPRERASVVDIYKNIKYVNRILKCNKYDIIHITGEVNYLLYFLRKYNTVVTVHDIGFYTIYNSGFKKLILFLLFIFPLRFAKKITYISDKSYEEAKRFVPLSSSCQYIIYNPISNAFKPQIKAINRENPIILHIGTKVNKNLNRVVEAVSTMNCKLHIIGAVSEELMKTIRDYNINVMIEKNITDKEIFDAYCKCDVVSFPSLYEGFGMPIIEGQAIGRPIVTSNLSPMNTIAGEGAVLVDPNSVFSIREGIYIALQNADNLIENGYKNIEKFSVNSIVLQYISVYKSMIN